MSLVNGSACALKYTFKEIFFQLKRPLLTVIRSRRHFLSVDGINNIFINVPNLCFLLLFIAERVPLEPDHGAFMFLFFYFHNTLILYLENGVTSMEMR